MPRQTRKIRPSPAESATSFPEGTIRKGGNRNMWVVRKMGGVNRWIPVESAEINGIRLLTVDYMKTMIGKEISIFLREYSDTWPSTKDFKTYLRFIPDGNARIGKNKKVLENWLRTKTPSVKKGQYFFVTGIGTYGKDYTTTVDSLQVSSGSGTVVSPNLMNTEAFVRI